MAVTRSLVVSEWSINATLFLANAGLALLAVRRNTVDIFRKKAFVFSCSLLMLCVISNEFYKIMVVLYSSWRAESCHETTIGIWNCGSDLVADYTGGVQTSIIRDVCRDYQNGYLSQSIYKKDKKRKIIIKVPHSFK